MPTSLADTVEAFLFALNDGRADDARAFVRPDAWEAGSRSVATMAADKTLMLQAFPAMLEAPGRAAVRIMGFHKEGQRESWWFFFEQTDSGWLLSAIGASRLDAERFLKHGATPEVEVAPPPAPDTEDRLAGLPRKLKSVVERLITALHTGDVDAARALTAPDHWDAHDHTPSKLAVQIGRAKPTVAFLEARVKGGRAAVQAGFIGERMTGDAWLVFREDRGFGWQWIAAPNRWEPAGLFVNGTTEGVPSWGALPADPAAFAWATAVVAAVDTNTGPVEGVDPAAWEKLTGPVPEGHEVRVGEVRTLPALNRAAVEIDVVDPAIPDEPDRRYALLERAGADAPWTFRKVLFGRGLSTLLDEVDVPWDAAAAPSPEEPGLGDEDALRDAVTKKILQLLADQGIKPESVDDLSKLPKEQLEKILPQLVGGAFSAFFGTLLGRMKQDLDEAAARDPEVTVDLERERAKRAGGTVPEPTPLEEEVSRNVRTALRDALGGAAEGGETLVDPTFLKEQGPKLLGSLFGAVAKAMVPETLSFDLPPEAGKDPKEPVKIKLELGQMLGALFAQTTPRNREPEDDEE